MPVFPRAHKGSVSFVHGGAIVVLAVLTAVASSAGAQTPPTPVLEEIKPASPCGTTVIAEFSWPSARLASAALERLLRDGLECPAERRPASPEQAAEAVGRAAQDPSAPIVVAPGLSAEASAEIAADPGVRRGDALFPGARAGFAVPDWLRAANPELETLSDAARTPERFTPRSGGRPSLWLCPESWSCHAETLRAAEELGFAENFNLVTPASGEALTRALVEAHLAREPWIGYFWTPSATAAEHPVELLSAGAARLCDAEDGRCREPFPPAESVTLYSAPLDARAPEAAALLRRFSLHADAVMEALSWRARTNASVDQTADFMLARFPELWRSLLGDAARKRFENALSDRMSRAPD